MHIDNITLPTSINLVTVLALSSAVVPVNTMPCIQATTPLKIAIDEPNCGVDSVIFPFLANCRISQN